MPPGIAPGPQFSLCDFAPQEGGGWAANSTFFGDGFSSGSSIGCCDAQGRASSITLLDVPEDADWLLQEHAGWWLAVEVADQERIPLAWRYDERRMQMGPSPSTHVLWVAADGAVVHEEFPGG